MDDLSQKLDRLLSSPDGMKRIEELMGAFGAAPPAPAETATSSPLPIGMDMRMLLKLTPLLAQLGKIIATAHEATHYGSHATTLKSVEPNLEILPLRSEGLGLGLLSGVICKVGICREYNAQSIFPVACHSINFEFFYTKIVKIL